MGEKTGSGFYKRVRKGTESEILTLDWQKMEYRERRKAKFPSIDAGKGIDNTRQRLAMLVAPAMEGKGGDKANRFLWTMLSETCLYAARRIPEIAEDIMDVDHAMQWGFGWEMGPFEIWDAIGVERMARALSVRERSSLHSSRKCSHRRTNRFTKWRKGQRDISTRLPAPTRRSRKPRDHHPEISHRTNRHGARELRRKPDRSRRWCAVLRIPFQDERNRLRYITHAQSGIGRLGTEFEAMVIANQAANFSVGANLMLLLMSAQEGEWDDIHLAVRQFQRVNMAIKYAPRPVVAAPQGLVLGGGCEISLHAGRIHATAETYIGLVETGVGLIPAGGGTKEMLIRANERAAGGEDRPLSRTPADFRKCCHGKGVHERGRGSHTRIPETV